MTEEPSHGCCNGSSGGLSCGFAGLLPDEVLNGTMHQDVVGACLLALATIRVVGVEVERSVKLWQFALDTSDQPGIAGLPGSFHEIVPTVDVDRSAVCFQIHGFEGLSVWQLVGLPNPVLVLFPLC